jgi:hypothetical protein
MAKIKIEIDTESFERDSHSKVVFAAQKKIRVISPITITEAMRDAFSGSVTVNSDIKYIDKRGYKRNDNGALKTHVSNNNSADLIVTAGGLAAYDAGDSKAVVNFISVVGAIPDSPKDNFKGCVSLESYESNAARIKLLRDPPLQFQLSDIGLFYNPNSYMDNEVGNWNSLVGNNNQVFAGGVDTQGNNDDTTYGTAFQNISGAIKALVISADPFFQDTKDNLIAAANTWVQAAPQGVTRYVCYPTQDYSNRRGTTPTPKKATLFGPDLATAYSLLGQIASIVLSSGSRINLRVLNIRSDL